MRNTSETMEKIKEIKMDETYLPKMAHRRLYKSFYVPFQTDVELAYIVKKHGENPSMVIRRLITEAYTILKYLESDKKD